MVHKIKGKHNKTNVHHLRDGHDTLTSEQDISNKLGQTFKKKLLYPKLQSRKFKKQKEKIKLNFKSKNLEEYNRSFSLDELRKSLYTNIIYFEISFTK